MCTQAKGDLVICHRVPGRLRIKIASVRNAKGFSYNLEDRLNQIDGIEKVQARSSTGSVIFYYDFNRINQSQIIGHLTNNIRKLTRDLPVDDKADCVHNLPTPSRVPSSPSILYHIVNAVVLSGFLAYSVLRRMIFKSALPQTPLSLTGIVATLGAMPLLLRAWEDLHQKRRMGLFPFLTAGCGLAILTAEALTALEIIWVLAIGMLLEEYITDRARRAIGKILQVIPQNTYVLLEGVEVETPVIELRQGATVVVRTGQKIPVDGVILEGEALVDEAHITGRSQPELHGSNDWVYAGTQVQEGILYIRADKLGKNTYLCQISHMVEQAIENRPEVEKKADILAARLTRLGISATVATILLTRNFTRALSVMLVMTCPCATVLATSTAVAAAIANAARMQILIKGGKYLEQVHTGDCFCFDKTGTITGDLPKVVDVLTRSPNHDTNRIIDLAASAEAQSKHPIAKALLGEAKKRGITHKSIMTSETFLGRGVRANLDSDTILVGNREFMETESVNVSYFKTRAQRHMESGHTVLYIAKNGKLQGMIAVANKLRPSVESTLRALRKDGIAMFSLISGDTEPIVKNMAESLGFDDYKAALLPEEKAEYIDQLKVKGLKVLMVGDGVNDALALSKATVGVAMGTGGSEVAIEASDIALVKSDLDDLVTLRFLSGQTLKIIEQNFWMATFTNVIGIILGAAGWLPPVMAGILHISHTFGIIINSGRLLKWDDTNERRT